MIVLTDVQALYSNASFTLHDQLMDNTAFMSTMFQRPFQYLLRYTNNQELRGINSNNVQGNHQQCIETLLASVCVLCIVISFQLDLDIAAFL